MIRGAARIGATTAHMLKKYFCSGVKPPCRPWTMRAASKPPWADATSGYCLAELAVPQRLERTTNLRHRGRSALQGPRKACEISAGFSPSGRCSLQGPFFRNLALPGTRVSSPLGTLTAYILVNNAVFLWKAATQISATEVGVYVRRNKKPSERRNSPSLECSLLPGLRSHQ
jgi:hypothetical protein